MATWLLYFEEWLGSDDWKGGKHPSINDDEDWTVIVAALCGFRGGVAEAQTAWWHVGGFGRHRTVWRLPRSWPRLFLPGSHGRKRSAWSPGFPGRREWCDGERNTRKAWDGSPRNPDAGRGNTHAGGRVGAEGMIAIACFPARRMARTCSRPIPSLRDDAGCTCRGLPRASIWALRYCPSSSGVDVVSAKPCCSRARATAGREACVLLHSGRHKLYQAG